MEGFPPFPPHGPLRPKTMKEEKSFLYYSVFPLLIFLKDLPQMLSFYVLLNNTIQRFFLILLFPHFTLISSIHLLNVGVFKLNWGSKKSGNTVRKTIQIQYIGLITEIP